MKKSVLKFMKKNPWVVFLITTKDLSEVIITIISIFTTNEINRMENNIWSELIDLALLAVVCFVLYELLKLYREVWSKVETHENALLEQTENMRNEHLRRIDLINVLASLSKAQTNYIDQSLLRYDEKLTEYIYYLQDQIGIKNNEGKIISNKTLKINLRDYHNEMFNDSVKINQLESRLSEHRHENFIEVLKAEEITKDYEFNRSNE